MRLKDKVCVVTGSSRGIGKAIAEGYSKEGAKVVITYNVQKEEAEKVAKKIGSELCIQMDVRDRDSIKNAFQFVRL